VASGQREDGIAIPKVCFDDSCAEAFEGPAVLFTTWATEVIDEDYFPTFFAQKESGKQRSDKSTSACNK
jgi:hypothetical protein